MDRGAGHYCDNDGVWGLAPCGSGFPRATALFKATSWDDLHSQQVFACGECAPRIRELLAGGGFETDEFRLG